MPPTMRARSCAEAAGFLAGAGVSCVETGTCCVDAGGRVAAATAEAALSTICVPRPRGSAVVAELDAAPPAGRGSPAKPRDEEMRVGRDRTVASFRITERAAADAERVIDLARPAVIGENP